MTNDHQLPAAVREQRDTLISGTVEKIRRIISVSALDLALRVGHVIVQDLYGGSFKAWRKRGSKCHSLRRLANCPALPMSATAIYRAVAIYELVERLGGPDTFPELGVSHYRAVLGASDDRQTMLLTQASEHSWTATQLVEQARRREADTCRGRGGRRPMNPTHLALRRAARSLGQEVLDSVDSGDAAVSTGPDADVARRDLRVLLERAVKLARILKLDMGADFDGFGDDKPAAASHLTVCARPSTVDRE